MLAGQPAAVTTSVYAIAGWEGGPVVPVVIQWFLTQLMRIRNGAPRLQSLQPLGLLTLWECTCWYDHSLLLTPAE